MNFIFAILKGKPMNRKPLLIFIFILLFSVTPHILADSPTVEIYVNAPDDTSFELDFRSTENVTHFEFFFRPPEGCRIIDIQNTPGEVTFKEVWEKIDDKYHLKYKIDIFNYYGISSLDYRNLANIIYEKYKLKGNKTFSFTNFKTRNNVRTFDNSEVVFYNSPYTIDFGKGIPMEKIKYDLFIDTDSYHQIENSDSCFIVLDCYMTMENTKEMVSNLSFAFIVPSGAELVRVEPIRPNGIFDPYKTTNYKKSSQHGYNVSLAPSQPEWPIEPYTQKYNGNPILKFSVHVYDLCFDVMNKFELQNIHSINEFNQENNETVSTTLELNLDDFYFDHFMKGDINGYCFGDNRVNNADIQELEKYLEKSIAFNCYQKWAADIDDNGIIDANDLVRLKGFSSIEEETLISSVFPNPAHDFINITSNIPIKNIELYDSYGRLVHTSNSTIIDVSKLVIGTYFVKINFVGLSETHKISIQ